MNEKLTDIFSAVDALNTDASLLSEESSLSIVNEWIDTGSYALNAIFSGSVYGGIPSGRITGFTGPSQSGKTLIINKIIANAQKQGYFAAVWDTEAAVDRRSAEGVGVDTSRVKYYPVETIEDCRNQIATFLDKIIAANDPSIKVIIAIDSLGNLVSAKEARDVVEGKDASDMGSRAKACLHPDTKVVTEHGLLKIKDLNKGDKVLTHLNRYRPVIQKWVVLHKKTYTFHTEKETICMSPDHKMLISRNGILMYAEAKDINKSTDKLVKMKNKA